MIKQWVLEGQTTPVPQTFLSAIAGWGLHILKPVNQTDAVDPLWNEVGVSAHTLHTHPVPPSAFLSVSLLWLPSVSLQPLPSLFALHAGGFRP